MEAERRFVEFRADGEDLVGTVVRYGDRASIAGEWTETFAKGSLKVAADVIMNLQHDRSQPVARTGAGLTITDTGSSIEARVRLPDTVYGRQARELVDSKILRGLSVEFRSKKDKWEGRNRTVLDAEMLGVAIVDRPAYPGSTIAQRFEEMRSATVRKPRRRFV